MRLAYSISGKRPSAEAVETARIAESLGLEEVWLTEDYFERGAFAVAGAIAQATDRVRIGLGVLNPWTRHPMLTAMETAALDEVADGRVVLGMGASNVRWMEHQLGIPFERPLSVLRESVEVLRAALSGVPTNHTGDAFQVDAELAFTPPQTPPPIVLGVKGPKALALAGEISDGVLLSVLSSPQYVAWARQRTGGSVSLSAYVEFACEDDPAEARERVRTTVATFLGVHGDHAITRTSGLSPEVAAAFRQGWVNGAPRIDLVSNELIETYAIAGDTQGCAQGIRRFAKAGLDTLVIRDDGITPPGRQLRDATKVIALADV